MRQVMVRYKVKPDRVAENEELVRAVYDELQRTEPEGLRYATFRLEDGVNFVHLARRPRTGATRCQRCRRSRNSRRHRRPLRRTPGRRRTARDRLVPLLLDACHEHIGLQARRPPGTAHR